MSDINRLGIFAFDTCNERIVKIHVISDILDQGPQSVRYQPLGSIDLFKKSINAMGVDKKIHGDLRLKLTDFQLSINSHATVHLLIKDVNQFNEKDILIYF